MASAGHSGQVSAVGAGEQFFEEIITGLFNRFQYGIQFQKIDAHMPPAVRAVQLGLILQP